MAPGSRSQRIASQLPHLARAIQGALEFAERPAANQLPTTAEGRAAMIATLGNIEAIVHYSCSIHDLLAMAEPTVTRKATANVATYVID